MKVPEADPATGDRPWLPAGLKQHGFTRATVQRLTYIVIDEIVGEDAGLSLMAWPVADSRGRLRFRELDDRVELGLTVEDLRRQLYRGWRRRSPRIGDVFAARPEPGVAAELEAGYEGQWGRSLTDLFPGPVYDVTGEAREVAKLAYYASVTAVLEHGEAEAWDLPKPSGPARPAPVRRSTGGRPARGAR